MIKKSRVLIGLKIGTVFNFMYQISLVQRDPVARFYSSAFSFFTLYSNFLQGKTGHINMATTTSSSLHLASCSPICPREKKKNPYSVP